DLDVREADGLQAAAFDLPLDEPRLDRASDVDGGDEAHDLDLEGVEVDLDLGHVRGPAVDRIGVAAVRRIVPGEPGGRLVDGGDLARSAAREHALHALAE